MSHHFDLRAAFRAMDFEDSFLKSGVHLTIALGELEARSTAMAILLAW